MTVEMLRFVANHDAIVVKGIVGPEYMKDLELIDGISMLLRSLVKMMIYAPNDIESVPTNGPVTSDWNAWLDRVRLEVSAVKIDLLTEILEDTSIASSRSHRSRRSTRSTKSKIPGSVLSFSSSIGSAQFSVGALQAAFNEAGLAIPEQVEQILLRTPPRLHSDAIPETVLTSPRPSLAIDSRQTPLITNAHTPKPCLLYTSPSPRDLSTSRMPSSA